MNCLSANYFGRCHSFVSLTDSFSNAGMWECPDFFPMPGDSKNRYILKYSAGGDWYEIGTYDEEAEVGTQYKSGLKCMQESCSIGTVFMMIRHRSNAYNCGCCV